MAAFTHPNDAVLLGTIEFEKSQRRLCPLDAVPAFRVSGELRVVGGDGLAGADLGADHVVRMDAAAVVHAIAVAVFENGYIEAGIALPRLVEYQRFARGPRAVKLKPHTADGLDQQIIHKQFPAGTNMDRRGR